MRRGERRQLGVDEILADLAQAQAAPPQGRVLLGAQIGEAEGLVGSRVQGAHDDPPFAEGLEHVRVRLRLLLQGGRVGALEEEELRAEQARALEVVGRRPLGVIDCADVGQQFHAVPVVGRALAGGSGERHRAPAGALLQQRDLLRGRRDDDLADAAVQGQDLAVAHAHDARGLHNGGDPQLGRQDRRVRGRPPHLGDDALDGAGVEGSGLSGGQVVGDQDHLAVQCGHPGLGEAPQLAGRPVADVVEIGGALGHVAAEAPQHLRVLLDRRVDGRGHAHALLELLVDGLGQAAVRREFGGRLQDRLGLLGSGLLAGFQARGDGGERLADAGAVRRRIRAGGLCGVHARRGLDEGGRSRSCARRHAYAVQNSVLAHELTPCPDRGTAGRPGSRGPLRRCRRQWTGSQRLRASRRAS